MIPKGALSIGLFFSSIAWGAWSVAITVTTSSFIPLINASKSALLLKGGFIL